MREGGSGTRLRQEAFMIAGGREVPVPDPPHSTWACQEVQEPEKGCDVVAAGVETEALGCDVVAAGTRELMTWSRERPSQVLLRTKSCSTFWVPIVTGRVWKTVPLTLAVIWY